MTTTTTTTALQALVEAATLVRVYVRGEATDEECGIFIDALEAARAALSAPPAAQDAPSEPCGRVTAEADRHGRRWHFTPNREAWEQLNRQPRSDFMHFDVFLAARASQPTPAQDAAATVQVPPAGAGASPQVIPISELHQHAAGAAAIVSKLYNETPDVSMAVQAGAWMQRAAQYLSATPPAPQVAPTAAPELLEALKTCHDALVRIREAGGASTSAEIVAERAIANAAPTAQAPALVPLTEDERTAAERLVRYVEHFLQQQCVGRVFDGAMAGHVSALHQGFLDCDKAGLLKPEKAAGITPTTKEQQ